MNLKLKYSFLSLVQVTLRVQSFTTAFYAIVIFVDVITNITTIVFFFSEGHVTMGNFLTPL